MLFSIDWRALMTLKPFQQQCLRPSVEDVEIRQSNDAVVVTMNGIVPGMDTLCVIVRGPSFDDA